MEVNNTDILGILKGVFFQDKKSAQTHKEINVITSGKDQSLQILMQFHYNIYIQIQLDISIIVKA